MTSTQDTPATTSRATSTAVPDNAAVVRGNLDLLAAGLVDMSTLGLASALRRIRHGLGGVPEAAPGLQVVEKALQAYDREIAHRFAGGVPSTWSPLAEDLAAALREFLDAVDGIGDPEFRIAYARGTAEQQLADYARHPDRTASQAPAAGVGPGLAVAGGTDAAGAAGTDAGTAPAAVRAWLAAITTSAPGGRYTAVDREHAAAALHLLTDETTEN